MITDEAKTFDAQLHFWGRLKKRGVFVCFRGVTDADQRWDVLRRAIIAKNLTQEYVGKTETFKAAFERISQQPLIKPLESAA